MLVLQAPGFAGGVEKEMRVLFLVFACSSWSLFVELLIVWAEEVFDVETRQCDDRGVSCGLKLHLSCTGEFEGASQRWKGYPG